MMRRFTSGTEPGSARQRHHLFGGRGAVVADAQSVTHRVEAREVARALARRDEVVRRQRVREVRAGHLDHLGAEAGEDVDRLAEPLLDAGLVALAGQLLDDADAEPADVTGSGRVDDRRHRLVDRRRVQRVVAGHRRVQQRGVEHRARERPGLVERRRERDQAIARHPAVRRFHADEPHTAAGCRIDPPVSVPIPSGASNAVTAALEPPDEPPGTRSRSHGLCVGPYAEFSVDEPIANSSMFVLPRITTPGIAKAPYDGRVVRRWPALEDPRPARRRQTAGDEDVLERKRHTRERPGVAAALGLVDPRRRCDRAVLVDVQERMHAVIDLGDAVEVCAGDLDR